MQEVAVDSSFLLIEVWYSIIWLCNTPINPLWLFFYQLQYTYRITSPFRFQIAGFIVDLTFSLFILSVFTFSLSSAAYIVIISFDAFASI